ncbi:Uncharacterised protein [Bordetella pertussis]|nr:Uncharacterised protein [Bordetella pertussis]
MANSAPTTSPKPQLIQLAASDTTLTRMIAPPALVARLASRASIRLTSGVLASM